MPSLTLPTAELYYETHGQGPLILCISGANGSTELWKPLAASLESHFTVLLYDRRGFSRSYLTGPQDYAHRIETDTDDAKALIQHLSPSEPVTIIGNSSGAIVALTLLQRHPEVVRTLIAHEPPAYSILPDVEILREKQQDIYETYRAYGTIPAFMKFAELGKAGEEESKGMARSFDPRSGPFIAGNVLYWFEREFLVYPFQEYNFEDLKTKKDKLLLGSGKLSHNEAPQYRGNLVFAEKLGLKVESFSGSHVGFASHPVQFAEELRGYLREKDSFYTSI